ncbi:MAG: hypothetical protein F6K00_08885 [Leptolyngbya sp. SIOISBB]|nr:hypothetical protein [Leptolyngbya sp. SIOISBB]
MPEFEPQRRQNEAQSELEQLEELVEAESANLDDSGASSPDADAAEAAGESVDEDATTADVDPDTEAAEDSDSDAIADTSRVAEDEAVGPVAAGIALGRLSTAPAIADDEALDGLAADVEATLESALEELADDAAFDEALIYRIAVSEDGEILGYKYENDAALENIDDTPLPRLTFIPVDAESEIDEPIAQFRITFTPSGTVTAELIESEDSE